MSLDLSTLKFSVNTEELELAVKKIEKLGESVQGLATSIGKLDKETSDASKTQSQANLNNAKTEALNIKNAKAIRDSAAATEELTAATKKRQSVEERQAAITRLMAEGNSRGQASILATAEALGEATEKTNEYLKAQRAMSSNNPFDRSLGAATVFANELKVATVASDLYNKDLGFTKNQLQELGREHVRLTEQFKVQGKSLSGLDAEFNKIVQSAQQVTQAENAMATSMKNGQKATVDAGKANAYIENELQKVRFALQANNDELNRSTSNSLVRFENALKKSGLTLDEQKLKIDEYRKAQVELQKTQSANKTDYITRAVGPQITDIVVGLSTGQSPLTVMMQQGGQLRDQFGMMGIAAKDMGDVMRNAMKGMAQSVFDTGKAIGTMLVGGLHDAGKAVINFGMNATGMNSVLEGGKRLLAAQGEEGFKYIGMLQKMGGVITGGFAIAMATLVATLVAWAIATKQVIEEESKLSKALNLTGASLGFTKDSAVAYASSMKDVGATTSQGIEVITAMAKTGIIGADSIRMVTEAAVLMEKYAGVAIEDTVKAFEKMKEKPVESMVELAKATGTITPETIKLIYELESQGKTAEVAAIAMKALADANSSAAKRIQEDLHPLQQLYMGIGDGIKYMWNSFKDVTRSDPSAMLSKAYERLASYQINPKAHAANIEAERILISQLSAKLRLEGEGTRLRQEQAKASADTAKWEEIKLKNLSYEKKESTEIAKIREAGAKAGISEVEIQQQVNAVIAKRPKASEAKESELQKAINKAKEDYIDIQNKVNGVNKEFNNKLEGQQLLLKEGEINVEQYTVSVLALIQQQKFYTDGLAQEEKQLRLVQKAWEDTNKAQTKKDDEYFKSYDALKAQSDELKNVTSEIEFQFGLLGKSEEQQKLITREHKVQNDLQKVQNELATELNKIVAQGQDPELQASLEVVARENAAEKIKAINAGVALQAAEDMQKSFDAIKSSITDVITTALFDGGKAGSKKLRDQVVAAFRNKITVVIDAVVNTALSELFSSATGGSTGGTEGGSSSGGILGALSTGKSFVDALSGSMNTAIATSFGKFASSGIGQSLGLSNSAAIAGNNPSAFVPAGGQLTSTGTMLQGAMASAAGIAAGLALNKAISSGYSMGKGMDNWQKVGTVIAGAINPALGAIVGAIGGLVNRAFGRKLTETGIQGTFGGNQGFTGQNYKFEEGGWFRSDKTSTSAIDPTLQSGLAQQFNAIKSSIGFMATMLGQGTDSIEAFTASIKLNFKDLSEEESTKLLQEEFNKISESLAGLVLGTTQYNKTGETNVETLTRLHTSLLTANSALYVLGGYLFNVSLAGADASQTLIDLMGGVQQFTSTMGSYYNNFYTEEERTATATKNLTTDFAKLGYILPEINDTTREWFRTEEKRLGAMDLSIKANADNYASFMGLSVGLNKLAPTFDQVADKAKKAADAIVEAAEKMRQGTLNANKVAVQLGLTTAIKSAESVANEAWATFKRMMPQASQYSEADIVNFARDPAKMKLLSASDQNIINTFVNAIGAWTDAKTTEATAVESAKKPYADALKSIKDQTADFLMQIADIGKSPFEAAVAKIRREAEAKLKELNALGGGTTGTTKVATDELTLAQAYKKKGSDSDAALAKRLAGGSLSEYVTEMQRITTVYSNAMMGIGVSISDNTAIVDAWAKAQIDLLKAQKAQSEKVDLEKQLNDLTKTSTQLLQEQRAALEESNRSLFDQIQVVKAQQLAKQATADYRLAMAEATGNTVLAARIQRELANATKLAAGWTQAQIDALNTAIEANKIKDSIAAMDAARVSVAGAFRAIEETAKNAQAAVDAAKEGITQGYLNALDQQKQAQENINSLIRQSAEEMRGFANGIKDFLLQMATTDLGADTKAQQLKALQADFLATAGLARSGDTKAYGSITGKAQSLLTAGKEQFSTQAEFARFSSSIANTLAELQTLADGKAGPLAEAVDPMVQAQADLLKANQEVIRWTKAVNDSGAATSLTLKDYAEDWRKAQAANVKAQADLLAAQVLTQGIDLKLNDTLGELRGLLKTYHDAVTAMIQAGGSARPTTPGGSGTVTPSSAIGSLYQSILGRVGDAAGIAFYENLVANGTSLASVAAQLAGSSEAQGRTPGFDVGTNYVPYDMNANIHKGERIIPEADNTELMQRLSSPMIQDNSELVLEIQRLNNRLATIESNTASTAGHAAKTARLLDRAMPDGDALATRTAEAL